LADEKLIRIAVNGVDVVHDGLVRAYLSYEKHKAVHVGDAVIAYDVGDEYDVRAVVEDMEGNVAFLRVDWDSLQNWDMKQMEG
jgi:hypothetical protein